MRRFLLDLGPAPFEMMRELIPSADERTCTFEPHGLSIVRIGDRGTAALHTWPEHNIATLDCYGSAADRAPQLLEQYGWTRRTDSHRTDLSETAWTYSAN